MHEQDTLIQGVIFDLDGTLLDSMHAWDKVGDCVLHHWNMKSNEDLDDVFSTISLSEAATYLHTHYLNKVQESCILEAIVTEVRQRYQKTIPLKAGAIALISYFKEQAIPCCVVTGSDELCALAALKHHHLLDDFAFIMTCDAYGLHKRDARLFELAAKKLQCLPTQCLVIEDAYYALQGAKLAGCKTAVVYEETQKAEWHKNCEIADVSAYTLIEMRDKLCLK